MLRLIRKQETVDVALGTTTFKVRLQTHGEARALKIKHSRRGMVDQEAMAAEFMSTHVVGWQNLADADGNVIPFDPALVLQVVDALPDDVISLLTLRIREPQAAVTEALGNGKPSSASAS
jgi:hypothetical protein